MFADTDNRRATPLWERNATSNLVDGWPHSTEWAIVRGIGREECERKWAERRPCGAGWKFAFDSGFPAGWSLVRCATPTSRKSGETWAAIIMIF